MLLLMGTTAAAQPQSPARERLERSVVIPHRPDEPVPEVKAAAGVTTWLRFDASIDRDSLEVEGLGASVRLVDVGERTIVLELLEDIEPGRKLGVRVRYRDGASPQRAVLVLVSHPTQVDKEVAVLRRRPEPLVVLEGEVGGFSGPPERTVRGVRVTSFRARLSPNNPSGLEVCRSAGFRARDGASVKLQIRNLPGQKPWAPGSARLFSVDGTAVGVLRVRSDKSPLQPGDMGEVVVETAAPLRGHDFFRLELVDTEGGRLLSIGDVALLEPQP